MTGFWREYGLIALLIAVSLTGYFMIGDRRADIVDYTLDMLGNRLVQLASDDASREEIAASFARFSERVERNEVSSEEIETVAANVLNLSARGAIITPQDAQLVLFEKPSSLPSPATMDASPSGDSKPDNGKPLYTYQIVTETGTEEQLDMKVFTERLETMFKVADAARGESDSIAAHVLFSVGDEGVHVVMDSKAGDWAKRPEVEALTGELTDQQLVKWNDSLARQQEGRNKRLADQASRITAVENAISAGRSTSQRSSDVPEDERLRRIKQIQRLGSMGAVVRLDTMELQIELERVVAELKLEFGDLLQESAMNLIFDHGDSLASPPTKAFVPVKNNQ